MGLIDVGLLMYSCHVFGISGMFSYSHITHPFSCRVQSSSVNDPLNGDTFYWVDTPSAIFTV